MDFESKKVYLIGIGGIGMSALARIFLASGKQVAGSDLKDSQILDDLRKLGVKVFIGHDPKHIQEFSDLVIFSQDITAEAPGFVELEFARQQGFKVISYSQTLAKLMEGNFGIAVTGTNGKSTTTAMLALILEKAGLDPTVVVGSQISNKNSSEQFISNARLGRSKYFVAEADEFYRKMLDLTPTMIVITNIAEDHLDYYKDLQDIKQAFLDFVKKLPKDGILIYNADDHNTVDVARHALCHKFTFGIHHYADLQALNQKTENSKQTFDLHLNDQLIGKFGLSVPGKFNVSNALGAALAAIKLGVNTETIQKVLKNYAGIWRRFEIVGTLQRRPVISDYAHHPAGVLATIEAAKEFYPGKKILVVFQPHQRSRTKKLFNEFVESLISADEVIVPEIFDVAGREHGEKISSKDLVDKLLEQKVKASFVANLDEAGEMIKQKVKNFDVVLMMGAGDIDLLASKITR